MILGGYLWARETESAKSQDLVSDQRARRGKTMLTLIAGEDFTVRDEVDAGYQRWREWEMDMHVRYSLMAQYGQNNPNHEAVQGSHQGQ